jgi:hypothetical protein
VPAPRGQDVQDLSEGAEDHPGTHADQAPAPILFDDLRIEQLRLWHPTGIRAWPFGLPARGLHSVTKMRQECCRILLETIREKEGHTARGQQPHDVMNQPLRHREGALPQVES